MSATTMHFGPEWMRSKPLPSSSRPQHPPSPPPSAAPPLTSASTYSSLVSAAPSSQPEDRDDAHPFRYSKDEMLKIYKEGGGKGGLGLEVERWEGVVREIGSEPVGLREMSDGERKLFAGPINSDLRRRQSIDYLSPLSTHNLSTERPRLSASGTGSPMRDRFGGFKRRDSTDQASSSIPRKLSLSNIQGLQASPGLASPRRYTPGFDGVLNSGGDSWTSRRRASEGVKTFASSTREGGPNGEVPEEPAELPADNNSHIRPLGPIPQEPIPEEHNTGKDTDKITTGISDIYIGANGTAPSISPSPPPPLIVPQQPLDLASVEWSYLDPQGNQQGPFRADIMQKWHDEGYFSPELMMKRAHIDKDFLSVAVLTQLAGGDKIFLSPPVPIMPPGINSRRAESPGQVPFGQEHQFNNVPFQPAPIRSLRSSTLDSYLESNASNSPASSFSAGRFSDGSPDPNAFGGRINSFGTENVIGRAFPVTPDSPYRRNNFQDASMLTPNRDPYNQGYMQSPSWPNNSSAHSFDGPNVTGVVESMSYSFGQSGTVPLNSNGSYGAPITSQDIFNIDSSSNFHSEFGTTDQSLGHEDKNRFTNYNNFGNVTFNNQFSGTASQNIPSASVPYEQPQPSPRSIQNVSVPVASPWGNPVETPATRKPGPFDSNNSTSNNTAPVVSVPKVSPWKTPRAPSEDQLANVASVSSQNQILAPAVPPPEPVASVPITTKARAKSISKNIAPSPSKSTPQVQLPPRPPSPITPAAPSKPAWLKDTESKPSAQTTSLRDIQEAENKKAEARKAIEKEKAAKVAATASVSDEAISFTASWGLPSSRTGVKKAEATSPSTTASPVWTNAVKPPTTKKSMKEIQEEEERRKKTAVKESVANVAARRGYAESTTKPTTPATNSAWSVVGPSGKPTARPGAVPSAVSSTSVPRVNGTSATSRPLPASLPAKPVSVAPPKAEDFPVPPSHDFLKWLNDSLKGLHSSVNVEEIMSMLLTFPMDPDVSTVELISEMIYSNSSTLDGRRFAAEYINKRKADAASRPKGSAGMAGKPISIADVVKAQPKPATSSEWGGFKVVNKKKKSRA